MSFLSPTVLSQTLDLLRRLGLTTIFGNPGSTEEPFLKNLPEDFTYVLGLQEASVLAMADGYAQATGKPALVNLHTVAGTGNAMGNLSNAWLNKTPLLITAGQQTREMLLLEPLLTNVDATTLPKPLVKWSYQPARPQDVPGSLLRAYATAFQPPQGPVYVSLPVDDWDQKTIDQPGVDISAARSFSHRFAPDPERLSLFAQALTQSENPALVFGAGVDRTGGWHEAVRLAELLQAAVYAPPENERVGFPEDHPLYQGELPPAIEPLAAKLKGHDVVLVVGAPVFRYYPYVAGDFLPKGTRLLHITDDPDEAARAVAGESLLGDPALSLAALVAAVLPEAASSGRKAPASQAAPEPPTISTPPSPAFLFHALAQTRPAEVILVQESLSNTRALKAHWRTTQPGTYLAFAGGGLGFGLPAAVGVALAERATGRNRRVVAVIGDGAFQYSVQALWTAVQHKLPLLVVVPCNAEYAILKSFAKHEKTAGIPGLDLPGLDCVKLAEGYGCTARRINDPALLKEAFRQAWQAKDPLVLEVPISAAIPPLLA